MKDFIQYLVKQIVSKPEEVSIKETDDNGVKLYYVTTSQDDMGLIIGKEGATIKSVRNLVKAKAIKDKVRVKVILEDNKYAED